MILFIDKMTTARYIVALFIWNVAIFVSIASLAGLGGLAGTAAILDVSDIIHSFDHEKSSSVSQLIEWKSRNLQKLLKYFNGTKLLCLMYYYSLMHSLLFLLYSKDLLLAVLLLFIL